MRREAALSVLVFVDVFNTITVQVEAHAQILRAQCVVQVGNSGEVFGRQAPIKCIQTLHTLVFAFNVGAHESHVGSQFLEENFGKRLAQYGDSHVWILLRQRFDDGHRHCYIAHRREADNQNVFGFHAVIDLVFPDEKISPNFL